MVSKNNKTTTLMQLSNRQTPSAILRHLFPNLRTLEIRLLWRIPHKETKRNPALNRRCHRWYASRLPHDTMRCHQDEIASRSPQRRNEIHLPTPLREDDNERRRLPRVLQRRPGTYLPLVAAVRIYACCL